MSSTQNPQASYRILNLKAVIELTGLSRSTIYDLMSVKSPRHDASFPKRIQLTTNRVGWIEQEVQEWIAARVKATREGNEL
jgi:prophage regulatory protein